MAQAVVVQGETYDEIRTLLSFISNGLDSYNAEEDLCDPTKEPDYADKSGTDLYDELYEEGKDERFSTAKNAERAFIKVLDDLRLNVIEEGDDYITVETKDIEPLTQLELQELLQASWNYRSTVSREFRYDSPRLSYKIRRAADQVD
ncbi:MAG: hypothetical protein FWD27_00590 [Coriobacteriia bacterium]|nr:hypothetical protein [Coriobacteriia bacterium]